MLEGKQTGAASVENSMQGPPKAKNRITIWSSNATPGYISKENKNTNLEKKKKNTYTPVFIAAHYLQ